jgi:flagellar hook-length control protein FliK
MISSPRAAAPVTTNVPGTPGQDASGVSATPFDAILALETVAATPTVSQPALDLGTALDADTALGELSDGLLEGDDGDDGDGDDVAETDPLAFLAALLAYPLTPTAAASTASAASAASRSDGGVSDAIDDALASAGAGGPVTADATPSPVSNPDGDSGSATPPVAVDPKAVDPALAGKLLAATAVPAPADTDVQADVAAAARAAEMLAHAPRHAAAADHMAIATPVRDPRWADDFSTRIALMVRGGESSASLQLTPVDLGPMEVSITVRDSQATIHFGAAQAETRALIEGSIPRLREMLAAQGFQLMDASVSQGFSRQTRPEIPGVSRGQAESEPEAVVTTRVTLNGLLDTYA